MTDTNTGQKGLILLGCPEAPAQVSLALHLAHGLRSMGLDPVITGNPSSRKLVEMADPDRHYCSGMIDLDACIESMATGEADYVVSFVLIHIESGVSYAGTLSAISQGRVVAVVFGRDADSLADLIDFPCEKVVVATVHKPGPLRAAIAKVMTWDV
ncbi:DUF1890 domain-containing protein [Methanofollis fontis]|uniref:DUF1890 domain-containing protein n=1 Tax=Methanofollis fontis TaxID=2052832 RepID=A0A483CT72_9EURY|nr:DUF1890 domain-containing protein [Methanofollis fontis]TAJ44533.1 DUF1890 domain-containing protein [Methanofollis fontis]